MRSTARLGSVWSNSKQTRCTGWSASGCTGRPRPLQILRVVIGYNLGLVFSRTRFDWLKGQEAQAISHRQEESTVDKLMNPKVKSGTVISGNLALNQLNHKIRVYQATLNVCIVF